MRRAGHVMVAMGLALTAARAEPPPQPLPAGKWRVFWTADGRVSDMSIDTVTARGEAAIFAGSIVQDNVACPLQGQLVSTTRVTYAEGIQSTSLDVPSLVTISAACPALMIAMEAFGLPDGKFLMSGRAIVKASSGAQAILPFALSPAP